MLRLRLRFCALNISISILNCTSKSTLVPLQRRRCGNVIHFTMLQKHYFWGKSETIVLFVFSFFSCSFQKWTQFFQWEFEYLSNIIENTFGCGNIESINYFDLSFKCLYVEDLNVDFWALCHEYAINFHILFKKKKKMKSETREWALFSM